MDYLLAVLALLAAVVGVLGPTSANGQPTYVGAGVLVVAFAVCAVTSVQHYRNRQDRAQMASVQCNQALRAVHGLLFPFAALAADVTDWARKNGVMSPDAADDRFDQIRGFLEANDRNILASFQNTSILDQHLPVLLQHAAVLSKSSLTDKAVILRGGTWKDIFARTALVGYRDMDPIYFGALRAREILPIQRLKNTWLTRRIGQLNNLPDDTNLYDFLRVGETVQGLNKSIFEEFLESAGDVVAVCRKRIRPAEESVS